MSQIQIKPTHELLHFIKKNQEIVSRSNALTILSSQNQEIIQRSNALTILSFQKSKDRFKVQHLKWLLFATKINFSKKDKNNLTNAQFLKNYVGLISFSQLRNT